MEVTMKKIIIDGAVYECDEAVAAKVAGMEKQLADSAAAHKAEVEKLTAEKDANADELEKAKAERDAAQAEAKTLKEKQLDEAAIKKMVDEKIALVDTAKKYGCEVKAEDSALDIKKAVVSKAFGDKMDLKDKNEVYVQTAFDAACIHLDGLKETTGGSPLAKNFSGISDGAVDDEAEKAHQAMIDRMSGKAK